MKHGGRLIPVFCLVLCPVRAQNISSSVTGVVMDPADTAVPGAICTLRAEGAGRVHTATSWTDGSFSFASIAAGKYTLKVRANGFKITVIRDIAVTAGEVRTLGALFLEVGDVRESVVVNVDPAFLQLGTAERSGIVSGNQLNSIALKGRDFFGMLATIPGVVDAMGPREIVTNTSSSGTFINGSRENQRNYTVDGVSSTDTGANESAVFVPNMDAIAEVRVLTSNYQAEYGRNSGGTVIVITKSGARDFHGSAYGFYRHESLNANSFFNNRTGTVKAPYRYRIGGYTVSGPVMLPGVLDAARERFFFMWSQEYSRSKSDYGTKFATMPTELERRGDFSRSFDLDGGLIMIKDPLNGKPFAGNTIPRSRFSRLGEAMLAYLPLPNYSDPDPRNAYRYNYRSVYSGDTPRRNDMLRTDYDVTRALRMYYRFGRDTDEKNIPWGGWKAGNGNYLISPVLVQNTGVAHLLSFTQTFSPALVAETGVSYGRVLRHFDLSDPARALRTRMGNPPQWFADPDSRFDYIPNLVFGNQPANAASAGLGTVPNRYTNPVIASTGNVTALWAAHNVKAGFYYESAGVNPTSPVNNRGTFDFSRDSNNPFDANSSFGNVLLGNFRSYTESTPRRNPRLVTRNVELYLQDNWRVGRRLTVDAGIRVYHLVPTQDRTSYAATFDPALYDADKAPLLYVPARNGNRQLVALDPIAGTTTIAPLIGFFVPGTGDRANGTAIAGRGGYPASLFTRRSFEFGPRAGIAFDLFGNGRTALRSGIGYFYDTPQTNPLVNAAANPPESYAPVLYYGNLDTYAGAGGALGPSNLYVIYGRQKTPRTTSFSFGLQHQAGKTVIDASYVASRSRNLLWVRNINPLPMFARLDPANGDPTQPGKPLPDNFLRPYRGYGDVNVNQFLATSNFNSLQLTATRRLGSGVQFGIAYTRSKTLGDADSDYSVVSPYFTPREHNYGPLSFDRPNTFVANYIYEFPSVGRVLGRKAAWVLDHWQLSGLTAFISGSPVTPGFSTTDGQDITGSSEGPRITVLGNPQLAKGERAFYRNFNTGVFRRTSLGSFGNAGVGILRGPGINNWDVMIGKRIPLGAEQRFLQFRGEFFNAWNHTQFASLYSNARFNEQGKQIDPNFGAFSSDRSPRSIQFSLRLMF